MRAEAFNFGTGATSRAMQEKLPLPNSRPIQSHSFTQPLADTQGLTLQGVAKNGSLEHRESVMVSSTKMGVMNTGQL